MNKEYKVRNIFNNEGRTLNDLICSFFLSFLEEIQNNTEFNDIINSDITLNL